MNKMLWIILRRNSGANVLHKCTLLSEAINFVRDYKNLWTPMDPTIEGEKMKIIICVVVPCVYLHVIPIKKYEFIGLKQIG